MALGTVLFSILLAGAELAAKGALGEIAKGAGKTAFEGLKARLTNKHGLMSLGLLEEAKTNEAYKAAIQSDLNKPDVAEDPDVLTLAQQLQAALAEMPTATANAYAIDIEEIRAGGNLLFEAIEGGIKSDSAKSAGDMEFRGVTAPKSGKN